MFVYNIGGEVGMTRKCLLKTFFILFLGCISIVANAANQINALPVADGLLVKFKVNSSNTSQQHALSISGLQSVQKFELVPGLLHVREVAGETIQSTFSSIVNNPNVEYVEPNYYVTTRALPADPEFSLQYGLNNNGQTGGLSGADVSAVEAWDINTGNDVVIAVIDTGVDYNHPDLRDNIWTNSGEIPNNGIDDDGNGFVDDYYGWDFSNDDNDPVDDMGHGTHVAGIIAARGNNNIGVTGVNWRAKIMGLKFIDANQIGTTSNAIKALNYAVAMGVRISNNSWGGGGYSQALFDSLVAANQAGHIFIAASGNNGLNSDDPANSQHYPSSYTLENVISVTATDEFDTLGGFANYGSISVDLAAPGSKIRSLWLSSGYFNLDGTSMAAPFVTGAAGLLLSIQPSLTVREIRSAILNNVDPLPSLAGTTVTGGRLNLQKTLSSINAATITISPNSKRMAVTDTLQFNVTGGAAPYTWLSLNPGVAQINAQTGLLTPVRSGVVQVSVTDINGISARSGDIAIDQVIMQPETASLSVGDSIRFIANGGVAPYTWTSANTNVVTMDSSGLLSAIGAGRTTITVRDSNGISMQSGIIEVIFIPDLTIITPLQNMGVGETATLEATGGIPPYRWGSMDTGIASIDSVTGVITALRTGKVRMFVEDSAGANVPSGEITIQGVTINIPVATMRINETQALEVVGGSPPYEWRVSNSVVAKIDATGNLTALTPGSVKVRLMDHNGNVAETRVVLITNSSVLHLDLQAGSYTLNQTIQAGAHGGVPPYQWSVSNSAVLSVNPAAQTVKTIGLGTAYVTITDAIGDVVSSGTIQVRDLEILPKTSSYTVGDTERFIASGGVAPYRWFVNNPRIASIDSNGNFTAIAAGVVTVEVADAEGIKAQSQAITISSGASSGGGGGTAVFEVTPRTAILSKRSSSTLQFIAKGGVPPLIFALSNTAIGSINANTGEYTSKSTVAGETTVVVTDANGNITESGIISVR